MFKHNLLISIRSFKRHKTTFFINLIGLSTGLACALLIFLWVQDELRMDKFHENDKYLYQVMLNYKFPEGIETWEHTPSPLASALVDEMPEINYAVSVNTFTDWFRGEGLISTVDLHVKAKAIFASQDFFNVFSYKIISGGKDQVLADRNGIVISEELAIKLFNSTEDALGKVLEWNHRMQFKGPFHVTGIFEDTPSNSTSQFDIVFNYEKLIEGDRYANEWNATYAETYLLLKSETSIEDFNKKISNFLLSKYPESDKTSSKISLFVRKYSQKYLYNHYENGIQAGGRIEYVRLFSIIALFILIIACINFTNLSTAKASTKIMEVGVKKALGAGRKPMIIQYLSESIFMTFLSLALAMLLVILLLPQFNMITAKQLAISFDARLALTLICIVLITGLIAGSYPAFYLSGFNPVTVLKGHLKTSMSEVWIRKGLVVFQFALSVILIVSVLVVYKQIEFVQSKNLGYDKDNVISFQRQGLINQNDYKVFISEIKKVPGVVNASSMFGNILNKDMGNHTGFGWEDQVPGEEKTVFWSPWISHEFIETLGIQLKEGRSFSSEYTNEESAVIISESAVRTMRLQDPIGKTIHYGTEEKQIVGVVKDFQYGSLHNRVYPVIFMYAPQRTDIVVRLKPGAEQTSLKGLKEVYEKFHPGYPFEFSFLEEDYQAQYVSEQRVSTLSRYFAGLAIIISCLGLFGLAAFTAQRRLKEIGIRKILGSTDFGIVRLLSGDFTKIVLLAIVIALPVSYIIARNWLNEFAFRIDLEWWYFITAGLIALLIAWFTVGLQTVKAARVNPVECLKEE